MKLDPNFVVISLFFIVGILLPVIALTAGRFLRPHFPSKEKSITYESGADPVGDSWVQVHVRYYLFALLFVIFDVEVLFLYPWAASYNSLRSSVGFFALVEMVLFIFFLVLGLGYAWKKKVLEWK